MMRHLPWLAALLFVLLILLLPASDDPYDSRIIVSGSPADQNFRNSKPGTEIPKVDDAVNDLDRFLVPLQAIVTEIRNTAYLTGELIVRLIFQTWQATPLRLRPIFGMSFCFITLLSVLGLFSLRTARRLWRRFG